MANDHQLPCGRLWSPSVAAHDWLAWTTSTAWAYMLLTMLVALRGYGQSVSLVCPHPPRHHTFGSPTPKIWGYTQLYKNNWRWGGSSLVAVGGVCIWFIAKAAVQRRVRKNVCNQVVNLLVHWPVSLCITLPLLYKYRICWPVFIFLLMNPSGHLSVSESARQIPHSQCISGGEQGVLPQNERRLLQIPVRGGLWGLEEGWVPLTITFFSHCSLRSKVFLPY